MPTKNYINRELSWLEFNSRVLEEANCESNPLLERVKFLAITASNLDEFFMVRVGGLILVAEAGKKNTDIAGLNADQQLKRIRKRVKEFNREQTDCLRRLEMELAPEGIHRLTPDSLSEDQARYVQKYVEDEVVSAVAPVGVSSIEEFPNLFGARLCICLRIAVNQSLDLLRPEAPESSESGVGESGAGESERYVVIPLGKSLSRILPLPCQEGLQYMFAEDAIGMHFDKLIGQHQVLESAVFRITRNADIGLDEDGVSDLIHGMKLMLNERKFGGCVRMELADSASRQMERFLKSALKVEDDNVYHLTGPMDFSSLFQLADVPGFKSLRQEEWAPQNSPDFQLDQNIFDTIAAGDRLLCHPFQSYDPVVKFLQAAAHDPKVMAIKQTLYRTSRNSAMVQALAEAAENGKNVTAIVELKARFDEARNIKWAKRLEHAGVDVIYGVRGLKTHAKICVVVRREPTGIHRYMHFGTGNYNEATARLYSDISYFTDDDQAGMDAVHFFNAITGLSIPQPMARIAVAPINLREKLLELIEVEIKNAKDKQKAEIVAKLNSLVDKEIIDALYAASAAGVKIRLNVRGICCLRAGVPGLSENIRVISIIDRFLEHARVLYCRHGGDHRLFISSADWMNRNLDRRVELMVAIEDGPCKDRLRRILETYFKDNVKARELHPDNVYRKVKRKSSTPPSRSQEVLYQEAVDLFNASTNPRTTVFKPHRGESA